MSIGKTLFSAITRNRLLRRLPLASKPVPTGQRRGDDHHLPNTPTGEAVRFRAIDCIRKVTKSSDDPQPIFISIMAVNHFNLLRKQIGYQLANKLIAILVDRLRVSNIGCEMGRIGRTSIEFAFASPSYAIAQSKLEMLAAEFEREIEVDGYRFQLSVAIGATEIAANMDDEELIDLATAALTEAQETNLKVFVAGPADDAKGSIVSQLDMMRDLRWAMQNEGLELFYQPKLRARTNEIDGVEALLRWTHKDHGPVSTENMIAVAEASGAIFDLTRWVIERAISDQQILNAQGIEIIFYLNLSGTLVADPEFCQWSVQRLKDAKGKFGFEITETAVIDDPESALANLKLFSEAGIRIAIDDYGSGLSSLTYLKQLPANELKIDRSFIEGLTSSHRDPLLVRSSIDLAHALEMDVTAEGVSDPMTLSLLRVMGCDLIQGYLVSHPLPLAELQVFLEKNTGSALGQDQISGAIQWDIDSANAALGQ